VPPAQAVITADVGPSHPCSTASRATIDPGVRRAVECGAIVSFSVAAKARQSKARPAAGAAAAHAAKTSSWS
jgi:hypothetical protein